MGSFIFGLIFAALMLLTATLNKAYKSMPTKELKRRARLGDDLAAALYKPAAYGLNVRVLLGTQTVLFTAASFVLLATALNSWLAFLLLAALVWWCFLWLPSTRLTVVGRRLGKLFASTVSTELHYLHPVLDFVSRLAHQHYPHDIHTGLYDKDDVINLLEWQQEQPDNRITPQQIELAKHALNFDDRVAADVITPLSQAHTVSTSETVGPILIDELHKSGRQIFPVYEGKKDHIIGTLRLVDVIASAQKSTTVGTLTQHKIHYVNEDFSLGQLLHAYLTTGQQLLVAVNSFEEVVGTIAIGDVLGQIVGSLASSEFDKYDDLKTVAAYTRLIPEPVAVTNEPDHPKDAELPEEQLPEDVVE